MDKLVNVLTQGLSEADLSNAILMADVAAEISISRIKMGMTQKEFAKYLGVSQGWISRIESGDCNFTIETLTRILGKLGKKVSFQITDVSEEPMVDISSVTMKFDADTRKPEFSCSVSTHTVTWPSMNALKMTTLVNNSSSIEPNSCVLYGGV